MWCRFFQAGLVLNLTEAASRHQQHIPWLLIFLHLPSRSLNFSSSQSCAFSISISRSLMAYLCSLPLFRISLIAPTLASLIKSVGITGNTSLPPPPKQVHARSLIVLLYYSYFRPLFLPLPLLSGCLSPSDRVDQTEGRLYCSSEAAAFLLITLNSGGGFLAALTEVRFAVW